MHLFPERELDVVEHGVDGEEVLVQAAVCETQEDAHAVKTALTEAGLWATLRKIIDDEDASYITYSVEVKGYDIEKSMTVIDRWGGSL